LAIRNALKLPSSKVVKLVSEIQTPHPGKKPMACSWENQWHNSQCWIPLCPWFSKNDCNSQPTSFNCRIEVRLSCRHYL